MEFGNKIKRNKILFPYYLTLLIGNHFLLFGYLL